MNTRRWVELALVLFLGILIGYSVAPSPRYTITVGRASESYDVFYRCDAHTGKTWRTVGIKMEWKEVPEADKALPLRDK
jgi:hypothetical protein